MKKNLKEIVKAEDVLAHRFDEAVFAFSAGGERADLELVIHSLRELGRIHIPPVLLSGALLQEI